MEALSIVDWHKIGFKDINPRELARQMTLLDARMFCLIRPRECFRQRWMKRGLGRERD